MNDRDRVSFIPNVNYLGFSCTGDACAIHGVSVTADTVSARIIRRVAMKAALVADCVVYHAYTGAQVICGVTVTADTVASNTGYNSCNSRVWSTHSWVSDSTCSGCGMNFLWCWVPCNKSR